MRTSRVFVRDLAHNPRVPQKLPVERSPQGAAETEQEIWAKERTARYEITGLCHGTNEIPDYWIEWNFTVEDLDPAELEVIQETRAALITVPLYHQVTQNYVWSTILRGKITDQRETETDRQRDRDTMNILSAEKTAGLSVFLKGTWLEVSWCLLWRHNLANTPDRGNFVVLIKKMGSCFLITNEFSTQFKTSIFFQSVWYWLTSNKIK